VRDDAPADAPGQILADLFEHDHKLVTTEPRHRVGRAHAGEHLRRHPLEHRVAGVVAETVVDLLEAVQIDEQDRELGALESGEGVVVGELADFGFRLR
jgi:hypothetical protein